MGVIINQSIRNTFFSYLGILLGAIYTLFFIPIVFNDEPEQWGLIQLLSSYILLFMPFALLGYPNIILKFWPKYSSYNKNGFIFFLFILVTTGLSIISLILFIFKDAVFFSNTTNNSLMRSYYIYFFGIFAIHTLFYFFLYIARVHYKTSVPTFLKDTCIKFWTFVLILLFWKKFISFDYFFKLYYLCFVIQLILIFIYVKQNTSIKFFFNFSFFKDIPSLKEILNYGFFSLLTGGAAVLVSRIDLFMISKYINLSEVAYYSIALFFITVLQVPARSLATIAAPVLSDHLNNNNLIKVKKLYTKTALNLFLISSYILMIILLNINEFMDILGEKFGQIKYVILILGISKLYEIINSTNANLIIISKFYRYDILFQITLLTLTIVTNILLIPIFGINGAAIATGITILTNTSIKGFFVYKKYKLHPYSKNTLKIFLIIGISILSTIFIHRILNVYVTIALKTIIISLIYLILTPVMNISEDINQILNKALKTIGF